MNIFHKKSIFATELITCLFNTIPTKMISGKIAQIVGPVIDVEFDSESGLPKIYDSLEIDKADGTKLVLEVQAHIGENMVRTIAMDSSDGLSRGTEVKATENPIQMPIGKEINGRLFNVIGCLLYTSPSPRD